VVQGCTTIFQSNNCLKNGEKQKSHFLFFDSEQVMDDLFRAYLKLSGNEIKGPGTCLITYIPHLSSQLNCMIDATF